MSTIACFFLTPLDQCQVSYRRYSDDTHCREPDRYCNASVRIGLEPWLEAGYDGSGVSPADAEKLDLRWPPACARCGRLFGDQDCWQVNRDRLFARSDGGPATTLSAAPPGAMWDSWWMYRHSRTDLVNYRERRGSDGICLTVKLPDGCDWVVDGPAGDAPQGGPAWTRTGIVPCVTASPSILTPDYHGWLRAGQLVSC